MGKITRHGGLSRAHVRVFEPPRRREPRRDPRRDARLETFGAEAPPGEPVEATPDGSETELVAEPEPVKPVEAKPRKRARKATSRGKAG